MLPSAPAGLPPLCSILPAAPNCVAKKIIKSGTDAIAGNVVDEVAQAFAKAAGEMFKACMTFWVSVPTPTLADDSGYQATGAVRLVQQDLNWFVGFAAVLGLLLAAGRMAWQRKGEAATRAVGGLLTLIVVTACGVGAVMLATQAGDEFSKWIIAQSFGSGAAFSKNLANMTVIGTRMGMSPGLVIVIALFALFGSLLQTILMMVRGVMLGLLSCFLPLAAAATIMPEGKAWFRKVVSWLIAFVLYKPVAAVVYAYAFYSISAPDTMSQLEGVVMVVLAVFTLPALMRFVMPMVSSVGGGAAMGAMAGGMAGAMGAKTVGSLAGKASGGGSGGGSGGKDGKSGATGAQVPGGGKPTPPTGPVAGKGAVAAAGPVGLAAAAGLGVAMGAKRAIENTASDATGEGGPNGSK